MQSVRRAVWLGTMACGGAIGLLAATGCDQQSASASAGSLGVGDAAPAFSAERWFRGEPREAAAPGRVTLVEFWATWCGPCIAAMPHISDLAERLGPRGLDVVAVSIDEGADAEAEVASFLEERSEIIAFDVLLDDGSMRRDWFQAAGRRGIPCSFVVDAEGRIAWIGHPMQTTQDGENELEQVIEGLLGENSDGEGG